MLFGIMPFETDGKEEELFTCVFGMEKFSITKRGERIEFGESEHYSSFEKTHTDEDVLGFSATNQNFTYFPRGISDKFSKITHIELHSCGLKRIAKEDLVGLENLILLNLGSNELVRLPDDLFCKMKKLKFIKFRQNKIQKMTSKLLDPLDKDKLCVVDFRKNSTIDDFFEANKHNTLDGLMTTMDAQCFEKVNRFDESVQQNSLIGAQKTKLHSDFIIRVGDKEHAVHKCILGSYSQKLRGIFEDDQLKELVIDDFSEETVESFIGFFYSNSVETKDPLNLYRMAVKFELEDLKSICREIVNINVDELGDPEILSEMELSELQQEDEIAIPQVVEDFYDAEDSQSYLQMVEEMGGQEALALYMERQAALQGILESLVNEGVILLDEPEVSSTEQ